MTDKQYAAQQSADQPCSARPVVAGGTSSKIKSQTLEELVETVETQQTLVIWAYLDSCVSLGNIQNQCTELFLGRGERQAAAQVRQRGVTGTVGQRSVFCNRRKVVVVVVVAVVVVVVAVVVVIIVVIVVGG